MAARWNPNGHRVRQALMEFSRVTKRMFIVPPSGSDGLRDALSVRGVKSRVVTVFWGSRSCIKSQKPRRNRIAHPRKGFYASRSKKRKMLCVLRFTHRAPPRPDLSEIAFGTAVRVGLLKESPSILVCYVYSSPYLTLVYSSLWAL
jgi:hypothetical protein